jgi:hypothetical protein
MAADFYASPFYILNLAAIMTLPGKLPLCWSLDDDIASVDDSVGSWIKQQRLYSHWPTTRSDKDAASSTGAIQHRSKRQRQRRSSTYTLKHNSMSRATARDGDDRSEVSQSSAVSLGNRQILQPTPPSSLAAKRGRSSSPSKKIRQRLEHATPAIKFVGPSSLVDEPESVGELKACMMSAVDGYIPSSLKVCL